MYYTLHQLQILCKVAETQSVTRAAEELHLTQPAVSIQLKNFQEQFDTALTEVVGRRIHITDFGQEIVRSAELILEQAAVIDAKTHVRKGQLSGRLRISAVSTGKYVMPYFLAPFIKQHSNVDLFMDVTNKALVAESQHRNEVDFSLVSIVPDKLRVEKMDLLENRLYLVGNRERKFSKTPYPRSFLKELPLILREEGSGVRLAMETFLERHDLAVQRKLELTSNEAVKQAVLAGLGYSVMPEIGISHELESELLQIIPVQGLPIRTTWQLIWPVGKKHSPVAEAFLNFMKENKDRIVKEHWS